MIKGRLTRTVTLLAASALTLGFAATGVGLSSAGAATATPGVTANSITIGATVPLSGIAVSYAEVSASANAVFNYINKHGGVNGRRIKYIRLDDCYNLAAFGLGCTAGPSTTTLSQTQVLDAQDHVFATVGSLGTAAQDSVLSYMKTNGVPQLFVNSGSSDWSQPSTYPNLFGFQASYQVEGKVFAQYIKTHDKGKSVGFIGQNDDFGAGGYAGLVNGGINIASDNHLSYNAADAVTGSISDIATDVSTLQSNGAKVVVLDSIPAFTSAILATAHQDGYSPQWIISSVGSDPISVNSPYEANAITFDSLPATNDKSNPWTPWLRSIILADKTDFPKFTAKSPMDGNMQYGAAFAVAFAETLKAEGKTVTRAGFVKTLESTKLATLTITPLQYSKSNHQGVLGGVIANISPNGSAAPIYFNEPSHVVYTTGNSKNTPIKTLPYVVSPIPAWLK